MAINAHAPLGVFEYKIAEDTTDPTVFDLQGLDSEQYSEVLFKLRIDGQDLVFTPEGVALSLKYGLKGWKNFDYPFLQSNFKYLPVAVRAELAREIVDASGANGELIKK
jgi:hypothetical protein